MIISGYETSLNLMLLIVVFLRPVLRHDGSMLVWKR